MSEINSQINHCDLQINEDLLTEIRIFKEILKVSKELGREPGSIYYDTTEELDILKWPLVDLESYNNIGSHPFDIGNVENRFTELMMEITKFQHQIDLLDAEIEKNPLSRLLLEVKEIIFRVRDSISDLECLNLMVRQINVSWSAVCLARTILAYYLILKIDITQYHLILKKCKIYMKII